MKKRVLSIALTLAMVLSLMPAAAFAATLTATFLTLDSESGYYDESGVKLNTTPSDHYVHYNAATGTVTMKNADIAGDGSRRNFTMFAFYKSGTDIKINLIGDNSISVSNGNHAVGIEAYGLTVTAENDASLKITAEGDSGVYSHAIECNNLTLSGKAKVSCSAGLPGQDGYIYGVRVANGEISLNDSAQLESVGTVGAAADAGWDDVSLNVSYQNPILKMGTSKETATDREYSANYKITDKYVFVGPQNSSPDSGTPTTYTLKGCTAAGNGFFKTNDGYYPDFDETGLVWADGAAAPDCGSLGCSKVYLDQNDSSLLTTAPAAGETYYFHFVTRNMKANDHTVDFTKTDKNCIDVQLKGFDVSFIKAVPKTVNSYYDGVYFYFSVTKKADEGPAACTVSFDSKGGSEISDMTVTGTVFGELPTPEREGYVFDGWYLQDYQELGSESLFYDGTVYAYILRLSNQADAVSPVKGFDEGNIIDFDVFFAGTVPTDLDINDYYGLGQQYTIEDSEISGSIVFDDMQNDSGLGYGNWRTFLDIETDFTDRDLDPTVGYGVKYFRVFPSSNETVTAGSAVPNEKSITLHAGWTKAVAYGIGVDANELDFGSVTEGYAPVEAETVTVSNIGDLPIGDITIALSGADADAFEISRGSIDVLAVGEDVSFTVAPKADLTKGSYTAELTVSRGDIDIEIGMEMSFTVKAASSGDDGSRLTPTANVITVADSVNGSVTVSGKSARAGETVEVTVAPDKGYTLETVTVTDKDGKEVELTAEKLGETYTFEMPKGTVKVEATFMEDNTMLNFFTDVPADAYYYDAVLWAAENGITGGVDAVRFAPDGVCTRAQAVTFLWRAAGCPEVEVGETFDDVVKGSYYEKAVAWAVAEGITKGTGETTFSPDAACTRGQIVTFLYRANKADTLNIRDNPFTDAADGAYYYDAVLWAVERGITNGTSATTFSPDATCTRAQIVTFLYRYMA